jgi:penicillin-binding protein 1A
MKFIYRLVKYLLFLFLGFFIIGTSTFLGIYFYLEPDLPSIETLKDVRLQVPLRVYSSDAKLIAEFGEKRREPLEYDDYPKQVIQAFLAAEDDRFFEHPGVDYQGLLRAAIQLLVTGERRQGGSTITMQVARNFFLSRKKTYTRKLNEIFLALKIERLLTKQEILELYLNKIYLGHRSYGVGAASKVYYGRPVQKLKLPEIAMIAGLPKAPSKFNPVSNPNRAKIRRDYVLGRMRELNFITEEQYTEAMTTPDTAKLHQALSELDAPYVAEMVRAEAIQRFGSDAYTSGYKIFTTLDSRLQDAANLALRNALQAYDKRHGYRGPSDHLEIAESTNKEMLLEQLAKQPRIAQIDNAIVIQVNEKSAEVWLANGGTKTLSWDGLSWARPQLDKNRLGPKPKVASDIIQPGDIIHIYHEIPEKGEPFLRLAQVPAVSGAFVAVSPDTGAILALIGGYDFFQSKFNRATQAKRQPGSGFKAFIYSAALEHGYNTASLINDAPIVYEEPGMDSAWRPENYSGKFYGPTRLRTALTYSRNLVSIRLLRSMGIKPTIEYITRFGFSKDKLPHALSLALGSGEVTPLQMAEGYSVLANGGYHVKPFFIDRIEDENNNVIDQVQPIQVCEEDSMQMLVYADADSLAYDHCATRVITEQNYYLMNSMMRDVIQHGTGKRARVLGRMDLAGKTGTTNDQRDAWFNGYSRHLVAIAWIGFDDYSPLGRGEVGGRAALPAWIAFMRVALDEVPEEIPELPPGMITMRIDPDTGKPVGVEDKNAIFEIFRDTDLASLPAKGRGSNMSAGSVTPTVVNPAEDPF